MNKMKIITKQIITSTLEMGSGFFVDIIHFGNNWEAWVYHEDYGIKSLMFAIEKEKISYEQFQDLVLNNVNKYEESYATDYLDEDIVFSELA